MTPEKQPPNCELESPKFQKHPNAKHIPELLRKIKPSAEAVKKISKLKGQINQNELLESFEKNKNQPEKIHQALCHEIKKSIQNSYLQIQNIEKIQSERLADESKDKKPSKQKDIWLSNDLEERKLSDFTNQELNQLRNATHHNIETFKKTLILAERNKSNETLQILFQISFLLNEINKKIHNKNFQKELPEFTKLVMQYLEIAIPNMKRANIKETQEILKQISKYSPSLRPGILAVRQKCIDLLTEQQAGHRINFNTAIKELETSLRTLLNSHEFKRIQALHESGERERGTEQITEYFSYRLSHANSLLFATRDKETRATHINNFQKDIESIKALTPKRFPVFKTVIEEKLRAEMTRILSDKTVLKKLQQAAGKVMKTPGEFIINQMFPSWEKSFGKETAEKFRDIAKELNEIINDPKGREDKIIRQILEAWSNQAQMMINYASKLTAADQKIIETYEKSLQKIRDFQGPIIPADLQKEHEDNSKTYTAVKAKLLGNQVQLQAQGKSMELYGTQKTSKPNSTFTPEVADKARQPNWIIAEVWNNPNSLGLQNIRTLLNPIMGNPAIHYDNILTDRKRQAFRAMDQSSTTPTENIKPLNPLDLAGQAIYLTSKYAKLKPNEARLLVEIGGMSAGMYAAYRITKAPFQILKGGAKVAGGAVQAGVGVLQAPIAPLKGGSNIAKGAVKTVSPFIRGLRSVVGASLKTALTGSVGAAATLVTLKNCNNTVDPRETLAVLDSELTEILTKAKITDQTTLEAAKAQVAKLQPEEKQKLTDTILHKALFEAEVNYGRGNYTAEDLQKVSISKERAEHIIRERNYNTKHNTLFNQNQYAKSLYLGIINANSTLAALGLPFLDTSKLPNSQKASDTEYYAKTIVTPKRLEQLQKKDSAISSVIAIFSENKIEDITEKSHLKAKYQETITKLKQKLAKSDQENFQKFVDQLLKDNLEVQAQLKDIAKTAENITDQINSQSPFNKLYPWNWLSANQNRQADRNLKATIIEDPKTLERTLQVQSYGKTSNLKIRFARSVQGNIIKNKEGQKPNLMIPTFYDGDFALPAKTPKQAILQVNLKNYLRKIRPNGIYQIINGHIRTFEFKSQTTTSVLSHEALEKFIDTKDPQAKIDLINYLNKRH
jgi:hypothetical protein